MGKLSMPFRNSQSTSLSSWYETQQMGCRCNHCPKTYTLASSKHLVGICRARCLADKPERYKRNRPCSNAKAPSPDSFVLKRMDSLAGARELFFSFLPPVDRWRRGVNNIWLMTTNYYTCKICLSVCNWVESNDAIMTFTHYVGRLEGRIQNEIMYSICFLFGHDLLTFSNFERSIGQSHNSLTLTDIPITIIK